MMMMMMMTQVDKRINSRAFKYTVRWVPEFINLNNNNYTQLLYMVDHNNWTPTV